MEIARVKSELVQVRERITALQHMLLDGLARHAEELESAAGLSPQQELPLGEEDAGTRGHGDKGTGGGGYPVRGGEDEALDKGGR